MLKAENSKPGKGLLLGEKTQVKSEIKCVLSLNRTIKTLLSLFWLARIINKLRLVNKLRITNKL